MQSNAASRSVLRDAIKRLKKVRKECGMDDDEMKALQSTGDPFKDACNAFTALLKETSDQVDDRNASAKKHGQDRDVISQTNAIMLQFRELETLLKAIKEQVALADAELARGHQKKKSANKIILLEKQYNERNNTYSQCESLLKALNDKSQRRFEGAPGKGLSDAQGIRLGAKNAMREQLINLRKNQNAPMGSEVDEEGRVGTRAGRQVRLEDDPQTREQMKQIAADDRKIAQGLDTISKGVSRLHEIAQQIGTELDSQNKMLDATEEKVDKQTDKLSKLNGRLSKLVKKSRPVNIFINIFCGVLLLALIGYLLYEFKVV